MSNIEQTLKDLKLKKKKKFIFQNRKQNNFIKFMKQNHSTMNYVRTFRQAL